MMGMIEIEEADAVKVEQAVRLFLSENPAVAPALARDVVSFNWHRGARSLEDLVCIEQFASTYSDAD